VLCIGVCLSLIGESTGEPTLEHGVFTCEHGVRAQPVAEAKTTFQLVLFIDKVQMVGTMRRRWIAEKPTVRERRVIRARELVSGALDQHGDRRVNVGHQGHHVDDGLRDQAWHGGRADVVDISAAKQGRESSALDLKGSRPGRIVVNDLRQSISFASARQVCGAGCSAVSECHRRLVGRRAAHEPRLRGRGARGREPRCGRGRRSNAAQDANCRAALSFARTPPASGRRNG
jgi:hypothetical protein